MVVTDHTAEYEAMTTKELLAEYKGLDQLIHGENCCYGVGDCKRFYLIEGILINRGYLR